MRTAMPPLPADIDERMAAARRQRAFWASCRSELLRSGVAGFVAAKDGEIIASSPSLPGLAELLRSMDLRPSDVAIEYISAERDNWLL